MKSSLVSNKIIGIGLLLFMGHFATAQEQQQSYAQELPGTELDVKMVVIPSGIFNMGSPNSEEGRNKDEGPQRRIEIDGFWMSSYEVTWQLYDLFLQRSIDSEDNPKKQKEIAILVDAIAGATIPYVDMSLGMGTGKNLPVGNVTQLGASKFCEWLSAITGNFYRLPTEAEWEYAARGGSNEAYFFSPLDSLYNYAWFEENSKKTYHEVGQKKPSAWGLYDMYGNVAEWTLDQYYNTAYSENFSSFVPVEKQYPVVIRGGSYKDNGKSLRSASRAFSKPVWKQRDPQFPKSKWWFTDAPFVGFRIVRPYNTPDPKELIKYWIEQQ